MLEMRCLDSTKAGFEKELKQLLEHSAEFAPQLEITVKNILRQVRERGDSAVLEYTRDFDKRVVTTADLEIPITSLAAAKEAIPSAVVKNLQLAATRIEDYHRHEYAESWQYQDSDGNILGQKITPLDRVGVYIPGGKAAYPSSVLMNVIPAKIAGVRDIIMVTPWPEGEAHMVVLAAAAIAGVTKAFSIGGAQAIAALAYGTEQIPSVDKITGPGNCYVSAAKRMVFGRVGIDMLAGPSEILIVSEGDSNPDWIAMDLFAQAEHDENARAILLTTEQKLLDAVSSSIQRLLPDMPRREIIQAALSGQGALIKLQNRGEMIDLINKIAPEHLELSVTDPEPYMQQIRHAGAIFIGHYAAEVFGDYCAGPNHTLPTSGTARFSSPLGVNDFQKRSSLIQCSANSVQEIAKTAEALANSEGLTAHARSAAYRLDKQ